MGLDVDCPDCLTGAASNDVAGWTVSTRQRLVVFRPTLPTASTAHTSTSTSSQWCSGASSATPATTDVMLAAGMVVTWTAAGARPSTAVQSMWLDGDVRSTTWNTHDASASAPPSHRTSMRWDRAGDTAGSAVSITTTGRAKSP